MAAIGVAILWYIFRLAGMGGRDGGFSAFVSSDLCTNIPIPKIYMKIHQEVPMCLFPLLQSLHVHLQALILY